MKRAPDGKKVISEADTRRNMLMTADNLGCGVEVRRIFAATDAQLLHCTNPIERQQIVVEAVGLLERLLTATPEDIVIDGKVVKV